MDAITFKDVTKKYQLQRENFKSLSNEFENWILAASGVASGRKSSREHFYALRDANFSIKQGESVGILGANGAGKTTILRLIANITKPTSGTVAVRGRIAPLIEVGAGFHPELTGRENVYLNGVILGMSKQELANRFDEIVAFSELEQFIDVPVKQYSTGMYVRLGFSVAIHSNFEILLADEILAVGDQRFQEKCRSKLESLKRDNKTLVLVAHSLDLLKAHCSRGILLQSGQIVLDASIASVIDKYQDIQKSIA